MSNLQSPTKLTEFAPLSPEGRQPGVGFLLSKFFKIKRGSTQDNYSSSSSGSSQVPNHEEANAVRSDALPKREVTSPSNWEDNKNKSGGRSSSRLSSISSTATTTLSTDGRSLPNVLKRISNLLAMKPTNLQAYEDTEFKQYWMPDSVSKECYECGEKFTTFRRRHHCRVCGQIFCSRCCSQEIPGKIMGCTGDLRVCTYCCKVVLTYLQSSDSGLDLSADLRAVQEDLQTKLGLGEGANLTAVLELPTPGAGPSEGIRGNNNFTNASAPSSLGGSHTGSHHHSHHHHHLGTGSTRRKTSVGYQEERYPGVRNSEDNISRGIISHVNGKSKTHPAGMRHVFDEMWRSINLGCHRYHLRTFQSCTAGSDIVEWLLSHGVVSSRVQAVATAQSFMEAGLLECISHPEERSFLDEYALYRPRNAVTLLAPTSLATSSPSSSSSSSSSSSNHPPGDAPHLCPSSSSSSVPSSSPSGSELSPGQVCSGEGQEPNWVKQLEQRGDCNAEESTNAVAEEDHCRLPSSSSFYLDLNVQESKVTLSRPKREEIEENNGKEVAVNKKRVSHNSGDPSLYNGQHILCHGEAPNFLCVPQDQLSSDANTSSPPHSWHLVDAKHLNPDNGEREAFLRLSSAYKSHQEALLRQLLVSEGLAQSWGDVVLPLVSQIVELVRPDVRSDSYEMDIRQYVQFKKVPGGNRSECGIISGVVCTKNIAHRAMAARLTNPRILLLGCSVAYQRVEGRFLSLEPLMMQEYDYLKNAVARIAALQPDLLLVEKNVSRLAQDFLLDLGVTLVTNVKVSVLDRVAHCTRADIVGSVDAHVGRPRLGACRAFYLKTYDLSPSGSEKQFYGLTSQSSASKTLMFFDGCPAHLGCTVILRGATKPELARLKRVVSRMVYIHYSWHLEKSFLMDEFAMPPAPLPPDSELFGDPVYSTDSAANLCQNYDGKGEESDNREKEIEKKITTSQIIRVGVKEKAVEDRKTVAAETVSDFSDPLHSYLSVGSATSPDAPSSEKGGGADTNAQQPEAEDLIDEVFSSNKLSVASNPREANRFRKALDDIVLSASPYLRHSIPYLDTEAGRNCPLRKYFPTELYWSAQFENNQMCSLGEEPVTSVPVETQVEKAISFARNKYNHPFFRTKLTGSINSEAVQAMLANFRAIGGHVPSYGSESDDETTIAEKKEPEREKAGNSYKFGILDGPRGSIGETHDNAGHWPIKLDALDPFNHQCLPVLLCSYSHSSNNAPYFCVNPWVCHMEFYGHYDIPLGKFLERYCFSSTYLCPSDTCDVPMLSHIRRFVHGGGCVHLALKELDRTIPYVYAKASSGQENPELKGPNPILSWSWCPECKMASPVVPLTSESWSMSFAKYLELRFHGCVYTRRGPNGCKHSLHQEHYQYFCMEKMVASFKYTKVSPWEISLPQPQILPRHSLPWNGTAGTISGESGTAVEESIRHQTGVVVEEIKTLALKGYEVFTTVREKLLALTPEAETAVARAINSKCGSMMTQLQKDQTHFKSKIEQIQLKLTSPTLESKKLEASQGAAVAKEVMDLMLKIEDCVVQVKRLIAEAVSEWNARLSDLAVLKKKEEKARRSIESAGNLGKTPLPLVPSTDSLVQNKTEENTILSAQENDCSALVEGVEADESIKANENTEIPEIYSLDSNSATNEDFNNSSSFVVSSSPSNSNKESKEDVESVPSSEFDASIPSILRSQKKDNHCQNEGGESSVCSSEGDASEGDTMQGYTDKVEIRVPSPSVLSFTSPTAEGLEAGLGIYQAWADEHEFVLIHHNEVPGTENDGDSNTKDSANIISENKSDVSTAPGSVLGHGRSKSEGDGRCRSSIPPLSAPPSPAPPTHSMSADEQTVSSAGSVIPVMNLTSNEKRTSSQSGTVKNILSQLLPSNSNFTPIQCPLNPAEHHLLPMCVTGIPVVVYESEPSSVIAYALSSSEYQHCIQEITGVGHRRFPWQNMNNTASSAQSHSDCEDGICTTPTAKRSSNSVSGRNANSSGGSGNSSVTSSTGQSQLSRPASEVNGNNGGLLEPDSGQDSSSNQESEGISTSTPVPPQPQQQAHIEVQFNDPSAHFYCRVYFAEQFLALRRHVLPDGEEGYVRSLSRCVKWTARGGKSGSSFYKTRDDRFILKNMSRLEVQIFLNFAPGYFDHMRRAYEHSSMSQNADPGNNYSTPPPTLLGKIIGVYRVAFRNTGTTNSILRANFLVMENLFYGRGSRVTQRFDLKGSMRNRLVDAAASSGGSGSLHPDSNGGMSNVVDSEIVLLDENLLKMTCESPLYIQSHSKAVLTRAINNDTLFLASQSVMDYSLLVGLDEEKKELIVGIIDYIRTFTWDKRLENMVKSAGGKTPTIIEPELYRGRFITAMHKYFLPVPDQWTGLGIGIDC